MNLDDQLRDALHDERLALPVPSGTLDVVRRKRRHRQALGVSAASLSVVAVVSAAITLAPSGGTPRASVVGASTPASATPIPGSTPAYYVRTARDWFLSQADYEAFLTTFVEPSPKPEDRVASPQPRGPLTDRLAEAMTAAGVPGVDGLARDEANSGVRGDINVHGTLPSGASIWVSRRQATFPTTTQPRSDDTSPLLPAAPVVDVPGTADAAVVYQPSWCTCITVVTPDGLMTDWNSKDTPIAELRAWAFAAARWDAEHPA